MTTTNSFSDSVIYLKCFTITSGTQSFNSHVEVRFGGSEWQRAWNSGISVAIGDFILIRIRQYSEYATTEGKSLIQVWSGKDGGNAMVDQSRSSYELNFDSDSGTIDDVEIKWPTATPVNMRWRSYEWHR